MSNEKTAVSQPERTINLRFAKASEEDVAAVQLLGLMLEDMDGFGFPRNADGEFSESDPTVFDEDDDEHCREAVKRLLQVVRGIPGGFTRITGLAHVVLRNDVFDPDQDHLAWHPDLLPAIEQRKRRRAIEAAKKDLSTVPVIEWERYDGANFNRAFSGYRPRHYSKISPEAPWVLAYKEGGGDITKPMNPPQPGMEPVQISEQWYWVQFGTGKEASHG